MKFFFAALAVSALRLTTDTESFVKLYEDGPVMDEKDGPPPKDMGPDPEDKEGPPSDMEDMKKGPPPKMDDGEKEGPPSPPPKMDPGKEEMSLPGTVLCPGFEPGEYCDGDGDCTNEPDWCSCPAAQAICANAGPKEEEDSEM